MREWAFSICLAVIMGCMLRMLLPNRTMGKIINFSFSIFLLTAIFSGVIFKNFDKLNNFDLKQDIDLFYEYEIDDINERLQRLKETKTLGEIERKLTQTIKQDLLTKNIVPLKILININIDDKSSILINKIEIFMKEGEEYDENIIKKIIYKKYGVEPYIKI